MKSKKLVAIISTMMMSLSSLPSLTIAMENASNLTYSADNSDLYEKCPYNEKNLIKEAYSALAYGSLKSITDETTGSISQKKLCSCLNEKQRKALMSWINEKLQKTESTQDTSSSYYGKFKSTFNRIFRRQQPAIRVSFDDPYEKTIDSIIMNYDRVSNQEQLNGVNFRRDIANVFIKYRVAQFLGIGGQIKLVENFSSINNQFEYALAYYSDNFGASFYNKTPGIINTDTIATADPEFRARLNVFSLWPKFLLIPTSKNTAFKDLKFSGGVPASISSMSLYFNEGQLNL